ncbi:ATP-dependent DNA helicase [Parabacteroides goldsteinii]|uniref:ATP-dependent DNA helicase n=1 Tax=Parabacteroides goldsteinii TaxID=328812 RepID=UPI000E85147F|nr:AAA family ATPase [Parabacteroides goldsteinii]HBA30979.1 helicase [Parabacteroides goldsteinii]
MESKKTKNRKLVLTDNQQQVLDALLGFIRNKESKIFILCGYAGTGKTTMMKVFIEELERRNLPFSLLASTGRAAKILSNATRHVASTVHSLIYKFDDLNQNMETLVAQREKSGVDKSGQLLLNFSLTPIEEYSGESRFYIVDESSMISDVVDKNATQACFGSGRLLADLLAFDSKGKFVFVGDVCQLPPILQENSPALSSGYIQETYKVAVEKRELKEIVRQDCGNDLILSAQKMRNLYMRPPVCMWGKFPLRGYQHIHLYPSQYNLLGGYIDSVKQKGYNAVTMLTQSNKSCMELTGIIRPALGFHSSQIEIGDLLLVTQNNYISGLMNGDMVKVKEIGKRRERAGLTFVYVEVEELFTGKVYSQLMIEDIVYGAMINLTQTQQKELFIDFFIRMKEKGIRQKSEAFKKAMLTDSYLNALRVVFGYVLTCHKAQGGEWEEVYLDIPRRIAREPKGTTYQWLYTAMTRARDTLHIVEDFYVQ